MSSDSNWHSGTGGGSGDLGDRPLKIGKYTIIKRIASGGMGSVYEAEQDQPRRLVALKLMHQVQHTPEQRDRFAREADLLGQLHHPNIAIIFDAGTHEEHGLSIPYIAMERVQGGRSIGAYCQDKKLQWTKIVELMVGVADALAYAHSRGVLHRDLKPANILVDDEGVPKIIDFGVGKFADQEANSPITEQSLLVGTLQYMSPEQAARGEFDERSDQYSFAMVLYELLCGQLPYTIDRSRVVQSTERIATIEPLPPVKINATVPPDLSNIVLKALSKEPRDRYASIADVAERLRMVLRGEPVSDSPTSRWTVLLRRLKRVGRQRPIATLLAASAIAIGIGYIGGEKADANEFNRVYERAVVTQLNHVPDVPFRDVPIIAITDDTDLTRLANVVGVNVKDLRATRGLRLAYGKLLARLAEHRPKVVTMDLTFEKGNEFASELAAGAQSLRDASIPLVIGRPKFDGGVDDPTLINPALAPLSTAGFIPIEAGPEICWSLLLAVERKGGVPRAGLALATLAHYQDADPKQIRIMQGTLGVGDSLEFPYTEPEDLAHNAEPFGFAKGDLLAHYLIELPATDILSRNVTEVTNFLEMSHSDASTLVSNRAVMIADLRSDRDQHPYPDGRFISGAFAHAAGVQGLISGYVIRTAYPLRLGNLRLDASHIVLVIGAALGAVASSVCSARRKRAFVVAMLTLTPTLASCASYQWHGWIWSPIPPLIAIILGWFIVGFARSAPA